MASDFTRPARALGFVFLGYFVGWPVLALLSIAVGGSWTDRLTTWWTWPVPCVFPVLSVVLAVDFFGRLHRHELTTRQVGTSRFVAVLLVAGAAFAVARYWEPLLVSGVLALATFLPVKNRAATPAAEA